MDYEFRNNIKENAIYYYDELEYGDSCLTLSTCDNYKEDGRFVVKAGSTVSALVSHSFKSYKTVEQRRIEAGLTATDLMLKNDVSFKSSSIAGEFVCGSSCNGPSSWKTKEGLTLKEWMAASNG